MSWPKTSKPKERYYLFAGMGGAASRRKRFMFLVWSVIVGALVSAGLGLMFVFVNHLHVN